MMLIILMNQKWCPYESSKIPKSMNRRIHQKQVIVDKYYNLVYGPFPLGSTCYQWWVDSNSLKYNMKKKLKLKVLYAPLNSGYRTPLTPP